MRRRDVIGLLGGSAVAWPLAARAQQGRNARQVAVLWPFGENDTDGQASMTAFRDGLRGLGWPNIKIEARWGGGNVERTEAYAAELVGLSPDVIFAYFSAQLRPLSRQTRTIPIVFVGASDPVGARYVESLSHPGGNITGFTLYEPSLAGKWLSVLRELSPSLSRIALLVNPETAILRGTFYSKALTDAAASLGIESETMNVSSAEDIEAGIASLAKQGVSGLIVAPDTFSEVNGDLIVSSAAKHRVPTVYAISRYAKRGGLVSYGPNVPDAVRRATTYVDRILRGEKPADLPVQQPVKFEMAINLKTARTLGLTVPPLLLARADEVIE